jgi:hypothetical protein
MLRIYKLKGYLETSPNTTATIHLKVVLQVIKLLRTSIRTTGSLRSTAKSRATRMVNTLR